MLAGLLAVAARVHCLRFAGEEAARAYDRGMLVVQLQQSERVHAIVSIATGTCKGAWEVMNGLVTYSMAHVSSKFEDFCL